MSERTAVYRFIDAAGKLLYVGVAKNIARRRRQHAAVQPWWAAVRREIIDWYPDRAAALRAEAAAIRLEQPRYNRNPGHLSADGNKTPHRSIRIADDAWADLKLAAGLIGSDRGTLIKQFLRWYLRRPGATLPERPPRRES